MRCATPAWQAAARVGRLGDPSLPIGFDRRCRAAWLDGGVRGGQRGQELILDISERVKSQFCVL